MDFVSAMEEKLDFIKSFFTSGTGFFDNSKAVLFLQNMFENDQALIIVYIDCSDAKNNSYLT